MSHVLADLATASPGIAATGRTHLGKGDKPIQVATFKHLAGDVLATELDENVVPALEDVERFRIQDGDVLIVARGSQLRIALANNIQRPTIFTNTLARIRSEHVPGEFLAAYLQSPAGKAALMQRNRASTINVALTIQGINATPVPDLAHEAIAHIAALVQARDEWHRHAEQALRARQDAINMAIQEALKENHA